MRLIACHMMALSVVACTSVDQAEPVSAATPAGALTPAEKEAFATLSGVSYPDVAADVEGYCHENLPAPAPLIERVAGYAIESSCVNPQICFTPILYDGYDFVEIAVDYPRFGLSVAPGKYRARLAPTGDPRCAAFENYLESIELDRNEASAVFKDKCVALEPIADFTAKYLFRRAPTQRLKKDEETLSVRDAQIVDRTTMQIVASARTVDYSKRADGRRYAVNCRMSTRELPRQAIPPRIP